MGCSSVSDSSSDKKPELKKEEAKKEEKKQQEIEDEEVLAFQSRQNKKERPKDDDLDPEDIKGEEAAVLAFNPELIVEPSSPPKVITAAPKANFAPEYVYGYRGYDSRHNLFFLNESKVVYPMAALGIVLDVNANTQTFFGGNSKSRVTNQHDDDIICLTLSRDKKKVASGQLGAKPKLFIWDAESGAYIAKFQMQGKGKLGVLGCAFSYNGEYVACVDMSPTRNIYVVNAKTGKLVWEKPSGKSPIYGVCWAGDKEFVAYGKGTVRIWNVDTQEGKIASGFDTNVTISGAAFDGKSKYYLAGTNGVIYVLEGIKVISKIENAHSGQINSISIKDDKIITCGNDKKVVIRKLVDNIVELEILCGDIPRAVDMHGDFIIVGNICNEIILYQKSILTREWKAHNEGEVWGLEIVGNHILTTGEDNRVIMWDYSRREAISTGRINERPGSKLKDNVSTLSPLPDNQCSRAICYNWKTAEFAIGTNSGEVYIRDLANMGVTKKTLACGSRWIECMKYSPDGSNLAVGTHDNLVVIYSVPEYDVKKKFTTHNSPIICIDWSKDFKYLRTLDEAFDMKFWDMEKLEEDPAGAKNTKDVEWETQTCKIGWHVQGIYPPGVKKTHVNSVTKSPDGSLLATGDDWGFVNLFNFPCMKGSSWSSLR